VFTGVIAYYLHENNPRTAAPPQDRLLDLVRWKQAKMQTEKEMQKQEAHIGKTVITEGEKAQI
jgi:hypothetical protein